MKADKDGQILLSEEDFKKWQQEATDLQQQIGVLMQQMNILHRKMDAYNLFRADCNQAPQEAPKAGATPSGATNIIKMKTPTLPDQILGVLASGEKKTNTQIKTALRERGIDKFGSNDAYYYTSVSRLVKNGSLVKEGDGYKKAA